VLDSTNPFVRRSVALALFRMLTGQTYDICVVHDGLSAAGLDYNRQSYDALRLHHMARFVDMPEGFHAELASQTLALFHGRPVMGDSFLQDLAVTAGLRADDAPSIQRLSATLAEA